MSLVRFKVHILLDSLCSRKCFLNNIQRVLNRLVCRHEKIMLWLDLVILIFLLKCNLSEL
jgi:hypothetical protein